MKNRHYPRHVWLGTMLLASWIIVISAHPSYGQRGKRTYRQAQIEQLPSVDVPSPMVEGDVIPQLPTSPNNGSGTRAVPDMIQSDPLTVDSQLMPEMMMETPMAADGFTEGGFEAPSAIGDPIPEGYPIEQPFCDDGCYGAEGPAPIYSTGTWFRRGRWYSDIEFLYMSRTDPRNVPVAGQQPTNQIRPYTLEDLLKLNFTGGTRIAIGRLLGRDVANRDHMVELEFIGAFDWDDSRLLRANGGEGSGSLTTLLNGTNFSELWQPFVASDAQTFNWDADYNQVSLNYMVGGRPSRDQLAMQPDGKWVRHGAASRMPTLLAGFRWARFNEGFGNAAIFQSATLEQVTTPPEEEVGGMVTTETLATQDDATRGLYRVLTNNDMFGVHIGAESEEKYDEWSWGLRGRIGALANLAQRRSRIDSRVRGQDDVVIDSEQVRRTDDDGNDLFLDSDGMVTTDPIDGGGVGNTPLFDTVDTVRVDYDETFLGSEVSDDTFTFVAEAGIFATFQVRPNLHIKAGYNLTYFSGLALATENLAFSNGFPDINLNGSTLLHGGTLGLESTW